MVTAKRLTDKGLKALKPKASRYEIRDAGRKGLSVRVGPSGVVSFMYRYQLHGVRRKMVIGNYGTAPTETLAEAHLLHAQAAAQVRQGIDPQGERKQREPEVRHFTVREAAEEFRDRHLKPNVKTWEEAWRILDKDVLPAWGERFIESISPREAVELLDAIVDRGAERMAKRVRSLLFQLWRFAIGRGMASASPIVAVAPPGKRSEARDRILTDAEIRRFWQTLNLAQMLPRLRPALRLLLITGQRRGEVTGATWSEFDLEAGLWRIPGERTKNGRPHEVPLSDLALDTLRELKAQLATSRAGKPYEGPYLFPSPHWEKDEPVDAKAITRAVSRNRELWGIPPFAVHDLRRTVRSNLSALGVSPIVAKKAVNHTLDGMDAVYDRHDYSDEKREALNLWADRLAAIVAGKAPKVTPIRGAA